MRYTVTLATSAFGLFTFDIEGLSEEEAATKAKERLLAVRPWLSPPDVTVANVDRASHDGPAPAVPIGEGPGGLGAQGDRNARKAQ